MAVTRIAAQRVLKRAASIFGLQQVTRAGLLFSLAFLTVALAAFASANNLLFLILAAMIATWMTSGLVSRLSLAGLELDFILPEHIAAGRRITGRIAVRNMKRWMPSFSIHLAAQGRTGVTAPVYFPVIPGGATLEEPVEFYFARRGSYRENNFRFATRFPFGLSERRISVLLRREVLVYPPLDPQPGFEELLVSVAGDVETWFRGLGHDFYRIRPYGMFESARHVDWKATAHTGELQVREFAREQEQAIALHLDLAVDNNEKEWFETAVACCAYLAWNLAQRDARVIFCSQDLCCRVPEEGGIYTILKYLAVASPRHDAPLPALDVRNAFQIVFTPRTDRLARNGWEMDALNLRVVGAEHPAMAAGRPAAS